MSQPTSKPDSPPSPVLTEIQTARLNLRLFTQADLGELAGLTSDPDVMKFIGSGQPISTAETQSVLSSIIHAFEKRGFGRWALVDTGSGKMIGYCGLTILDEAVGVELVLLLARSHWGKGFGFEAAHATLRFGFEELQLHEISALTMPGNTRARHLVDELKMGFLRDGHMYGVDCVYYSIKSQDFHADESPYTLRRFSRRADSSDDNSPPVKTSLQATV